MGDDESQRASDEVPVPSAQVRVSTPSVTAKMGLGPVHKVSDSPDISNEMTDAIQGIVDQSMAFDLVKTNIKLPRTNPDLLRELAKHPWKRGHVEVKAWRECDRRYKHQMMLSLRAREQRLRLEYKAKQESLRRATGLDQVKLRRSTRSHSPTSMRRGDDGPFARSTHKYVQGPITYQPPSIDDIHSPMLPSRWGASSPLSFLPPIRALPDSMGTAQSRHEFRLAQRQRQMLNEEVAFTCDEIELMEKRAMVLGEHRERKEGNQSSKVASKVASKMPSQSGSQRPSFFEGSAQPSGLNSDLASGITTGQASRAISPSHNAAALRAVERV